MRDQRAFDPRRGLNGGLLVLPSFLTGQGRPSYLRPHPLGSETLLPRKFQHLLTVPALHHPHPSGVPCSQSKIQ
ncbi:hypothetical protein CALCODRAFT_342587 [Calocera cornea HHB12733]|uniref:Uncharacterized protein n=1 Tax=Calocera cornea HHB12733 TaxID=1353952 RepID=A0A165EX03_9BASI|nr:hypothetical protein CALCODRAFT_342587 [Calocera cornea HHB12733]